MVSAPIAFLIYLFIQPTYEASSLLRIEPAQPEIFGPLETEKLAVRARSSTYLKTQVSLITSDKVLDLPLPILWSSTSPRSKSLKIPRAISVRN